MEASISTDVNPGIRPGEDNHAARKRGRNSNLEKKDTIGDFKEMGAALQAIIEAQEKFEPMLAQISYERANGFNAGVNPDFDKSIMDLEPDGGKEINYSVLVPGNPDKVDAQLPARTAQLSLSCGPCHRIFRDVGALEDHYVFAPSHNRNLACLTCDKVFNDDGKLRQHIQGTDPDPTHHCKFTRKQPEFFCPSCIIVFSERGDLDKHLKTKLHRCMIWRCDDCGIYFDHIREKRMHEETTLVHAWRGSQWWCDFCRRGYQTKDALSEHYRSSKVHNGMHVRGCEPRSEVEAKKRGETVYRPDGRDAPGPKRGYRTDAWKQRIERQNAIQEHGKPAQQDYLMDIDQPKEIQKPVLAEVQVTAVPSFGFSMDELMGKVPMKKIEKPVLSTTKKRYIENEKRRKQKREAQIAIAKENARTERLLKNKKMRKVQKNSTHDDDGDLVDYGDAPDSEYETDWSAMGDEEHAFFVALRKKERNEAKKINMKTLDIRVGAPKPASGPPKPNIHNTESPTAEQMIDWGFHIDRELLENTAQELVAEGSFCTVDDAIKWQLRTVRNQRIAAIVEEETAEEERLRHEAEHNIQIKRKKIVQDSSDQIATFAPQKSDQLIFDVPMTLDIDNTQTCNGSKSDFAGCLIPEQPAFEWSSSGVDEMLIDIDAPEGTSPSNSELLSCFMSSNSNQNNGMSILDDQPLSLFTTPMPSLSPVRAPPGYMNFPALTPSNLMTTPTTTTIYEAGLHSMTVPTVMNQVHQTEGEKSKQTEVRQEAVSVSYFWKPAAESNTSKIMMERKAKAEAEQIAISNAENISEGAAGQNLKPVSGPVVQGPFFGYENQLALFDAFVMNKDTVCNENNAVSGLEQAQAQAADAQSAEAQAAEVRAAKAQAAEARVARIQAAIAARAQAVKAQVAEAQVSSENLSNTYKIVMERKAKADAEKIAKAKAEHMKRKAKAEAEQKERKAKDEAEMKERMAKDEAEQKERKAKDEAEVKERKAKAAAKRKERKAKSEAGVMERKAKTETEMNERRAKAEAWAIAMSKAENFDEAAGQLRPVRGPVLQKSYFDDGEPLDTWDAFIEKKHRVYNKNAADSVLEQAQAQTNSPNSGNDTISPDALTEKPELGASFQREHDQFQLKQQEAVNAPEGAEDDELNAKMAKSKALVEYKRIQIENKAKFEHLQSEKQEQSAHPQYVSLDKAELFRRWSMAAPSEALRVGKSWVKGPDGVFVPGIDYGPDGKGPNGKGPEVIQQATPSNDEMDIDTPENRNNTANTPNETPRVPEPSTPTKNTNRNGQLLTPPDTKPELSNTEKLLKSRRNRGVNGNKSNDQNSNNARGKRKEYSPTGQRNKVDRRTRFKANPRAHGVCPNAQATDKTSTVIKYFKDSTGKIWETMTLKSTNNPGFCLRRIDSSVRDAFPRSDAECDERIKATQCRQKRTYVVLQKLSRKFGWEQLRYELAEEKLTWLSGDEKAKYLLGRRY